MANAGGSTFKMPWYLNLIKGPLSMMTRMTNKGDTIKFLAKKASWEFSIIDGRSDSRESLPTKSCNKGI